MLVPPMERATRALAAMPNRYSLRIPPPALYVAIATTGCIRQSLVSGSPINGSEHRPKSSRSFAKLEQFRSRSLGVSLERVPHKAQLSRTAYSIHQDT